MKQVVPYWGKSKLHVSHDNSLDLKGGESNCPFEVSSNVENHKVLTY